MAAEKHAKMWWQYLTWNEIVERARTCDLAILPLGAIEQHGPHLPTGHDTLQLFPMLESIAERTGAMLLPCPWYGAHPYHHYKFPGTIPLQNDTLRALIKDVVRGAAFAGYNKYIIFFGHGEAFVANYTVHELGLEGYFVASVMFQNLVRDLHPEIMETGFAHADESETSIGLYTHPEYIDMSKARKEIVTPLVSREFFHGVSDVMSGKPCRFDELTRNRPEYKHLKTGIIGDATLATEEKGRRYVQVIVDRMTAFINHIMETYPAGTKPPVD